MSAPIIVSPDRPVADRRVALVEDCFARSIDAASQFFAAQAPRIADVCAQLATCFQQGGTLLVSGTGAQVSDAHHVAVEFVHPIIVGKRALPALALVGVGHDDEVADAVTCLGHSRDALLTLSAGGEPVALTRALAAAQRKGMLTLRFSGGGGATEVDGFDVLESDPMIVQEVHETLYHVLWELVHVFLEHDCRDVPSNDAPGTDIERQLYPFLFVDAAHVGPAHDALTSSVRASTVQKSIDVCDLRRAVCVADTSRIADAGRAMAEHFRGGGRLLAFGNGGSATDAEDAAADCMQPPVRAWRSLPALALTNDVGTVTAVGNDVGFDHVFSRQVTAFGRGGDIALAISTSGTSRNILAALADARARGLLTIGLTGCDGGPLAQSGAADFCFIVPSDYTPRIQEVHATIWHAMLTVVQAELRLTSPW